MLARGQRSSKHGETALAMSAASSIITNHYFRGYFYHAKLHLQAAYNRGIRCQCGAKAEQMDKGRQSCKGYSVQVKIGFKSQS
jgi:hypothetical protein